MLKLRPMGGFGFLPKWGFGGYGGDAPRWQWHQVAVSRPDHVTIHLTLLFLPCSLSLSLSPPHFSSCGSCHFKRSSLSFWVFLPQVFLFLHPFPEWHLCHKLTTGSWSSIQFISYLCLKWAYKSDVYHQQITFSFFHWGDWVLIERICYTPSKQEMQRNLLFKAFQEGCCNILIGGLAHPHKSRKLTLTL